MLARVKMKVNVKLDNGHGISYRFKLKWIRMRRRVDDGCSILCFACSVSEK